MKKSKNNLDRLLRSEVKKMLTKLQNIDQSKVEDDEKPGKLDLKKFNNLPEVVELINKFQEMGVTREWLFENGFLPAGMILRF